MTETGCPTMDAIVPDITSQAILNGAMTKLFPEERAEIEQHLSAFGAAVIRHNRKELDTKSLQRYFLAECGWNEFQAIWYRVRIEEFLVVARANRSQGHMGE